MKKFIRSIMVMMSMLLCVGCFAACGAPSITSIKIGGVPAYMEVGDATTLTLELTPENASVGDVVWSSSNESVATINASGKVTALKPGSTIITAMNKKNTNVKDSVPLRVYGEDEKVKLGDKAYTYDKQPHDIELIEAPEGMELTYLYKNNATNEVSPNKPVDAGTYTVSAIDNASGEVVATATLTIHQKEAKLIINDCNKYFSKNDPTFTATVEGLIGEDQITYTLSRVQGENVGKYIISASITPTNNYYVVPSEGKLTISPLDVSLEVDNKTSVYGDPLTQTTYTLFEGNSVLDESLKANVFGNLVIDMPAGISRLPVNSYTISCENLTSTNLNIINRKNGVYSVTKKIATVSIAAGQYKYAGTIEPALQYAIDGTMEGDDLTGCLYRREGETVGFYEYFLNQTINTNYTLAFNESLTTYSFEIKSNIVSISFKDFEVFYSEENAEDVIPEVFYDYEVTLNGNPIDYVLGAQGQILISSTDAIILNHTVTKELHMSDEEKDKYYQKWNIAIEKTAISGYDDELKYTFTFVPGFKYIKLIPLEVTATALTKIYGESDPELTYSVEGFITEEDTPENVISEITLKRESGENVSTYEIKLADEIKLYDGKTYYKPTFKTNTFDIVKRELRVKPINHTVYYGEPEKELTIDTTDLNISARDTLSRILGGTLTRAETENVGDYPILGSNLSLLSDNYYLTYISGTYSIIPRPVIVQAINQSIEYGETISRYQYSYNVIKEFTEKDEDGEDITVFKDYVLQDPTFSGSLALTDYGVLYAGNSYTIGRGNLSTNPNFSVTYLPGSLTITKRQVSISFTALAYGFEEYQTLNPEPEYTFTPGLAYSDTCRIVHVGTTSPQDSSIISILKDENDQYVLELEFCTGEGTILPDCYEVVVNSNYTELFYLGTDLLNISVTALDDSSTVLKTYGQDYSIENIFKVTTNNPNYTIKLIPNAYNVKGVTDVDTHITPNSYEIDAGTYTVTIFPALVVIKDKNGSVVTENFALNIVAYASLVIEKAVLTCEVEPTVKTILYGTKSPEFNGGTYKFVNENGDPITIVGTNEEYSTADTSSYVVSEAAHLISATFAPNNKNFKNVIHSNIQLFVDRCELDTTVLKWTYGTSVEDHGVLTDETYTTQTIVEGVSHTTYEGDYTLINEYSIPRTLSNFRFLKQTLSIDHLYYGVTYHDDPEENGDGGYLYYIDGETVKKVFPRNSTSFFATYNTSSLELEIYYTDGSNNYLLTNEATLAANKKPTYLNTIYAPLNAGIYFSKATLKSLDGNYTVFEDNDDSTITETISYHNLFVIEKLVVDVSGFTNTIIYDNELIFNYLTNPSDIYGKVTKYFAKIDEDEYEELATLPEDVGEYAVTFIIDKANYYYYAEHIDFSIIPVTIEVRWGNTDTFNFISTTSTQTRAFAVYANNSLVYEIGQNMQIPEWLIIEYSGLMENGQAYPTGGGKTLSVPSFAGEYTIDISTKTTADGSHNYIGESHNTYYIAPIFYNGNINISRGSLTYDVAYNNGSTGAIALYNKIVEEMVKIPEEENINDYNIVLSYSGLLIDPTGTDTAFVSKLNMAGGPYRINMTISSKDGNIKETLKTASLSVGKTSVPLMSGYSDSIVEISYTGTFVYNELKALDGSAIFTPQPEYYNSSTKTYEYRHNNNKDIYFGITYNYYQVMSTSNREGVLTTAPKNPDDSQSFIYLVKAVITAGANYNPPVQTEYYGYYYVVKTTVDMTASNLTVEYTGQPIPAPEVLVTNKDLKEVLIKYETNANIEGVYVERIIKRNGTKVDFIRDVGEYVITFTIKETTNFYEIGSKFTTSCTITITPKKIVNVNKFVIEPATFITEDFANSTKGLKIDLSKAKQANPDYASGTSLYIEILITNKNDGTGVIYEKSDWKTLPAGTYYYFVSPLNKGNMPNYAQSDYIAFTLNRQVYDLEINDDVKDGITINYTPGGQSPYSYTNVTVKKNGVTQKSFDQDDFEILYKSFGVEEEYVLTPPTLNGVYEVKIRLLSENGLYESEYQETKLTISAPMLNIAGTIRMTYGQADTTLFLDIYATGTRYEDGLISSYDATTGKFTYNNTSDKGFWFIFKQDFGVDYDSAELPTEFNVTRDDGLPFNIMPDVNSLLEACDGEISTVTQLNSFDVGSNYIYIFYVSKDNNFAVSYAEFSVSVSAFNLTHDIISGVENNKGNSSGEEVPLTFSKDASLSENQITISKAISLEASSIYASGWTYENISIVSDITTFNINLGLPTGDRRNPLPTTLEIVATASANITSEQINNFFTGASGVKNVPIIVEGTIQLSSSQFSMSNVVRFVLSISFAKTTTSAFLSLADEHSAPLEFAYGSYYLDEYWGHDRVPDTILENPDYVNKSSHIYLYNLIKFPEYGDGVEGDALISAFREAWSPSGETFTLYEISVYASDNAGNKTGSLVASNTKYNKDDEERNSTGDHLYDFYFYDIDPQTNAGLYYLEIKLLESNYFTTTTIIVYVRIKPTTFYAKTQLTMFDKVVQSSVAADKNENIQLYHSATNDASNSVKEASFTINYYSDKSKTTLAYSSSVSYNRHNPVYTAKSGGTFSSYAAMVEHSLTAGTKEYTVEIIPNDANSIYVEDITILVLGRTIDLGVFNIYDVLDVNAMASETDGENPKYPELATLASIGTLSWPDFIQQILDKSGNSLTEDAISIMRLLDDSATEVTPVDSVYTFDIVPNANHQFEINDLLMPLLLEDGSQVVIKVKLAINLKLVTKSNTTNFTYNSSAQAPTITPYFQGWRYSVKQNVDGTLDVNNSSLSEIIDTTKPYTGTAKSVVYVNLDTGSSSNTPPTNAGNYKVVTTYEVSFAGDSRTITFECSNNFTISKAKASVTINSAEVLYDGASHPLQGTSSIEGLTVVTTHYTSLNVVEAAPRAAGVYRAVATISDINYYGTAEAILTIRTTAITIVLTPPDNFVYSGSIISPTYAVYNEDNVDITSSLRSSNKLTVKYNGSNYGSTKAGSYTFVLTVAKGNTLAGEATYSYVIEKANPIINFVAPASNAYTGSAIVPEVSIIPSSLASDMTVTYNGSTTRPTAAGTYQVHAKYTPATDSNYNSIEASYTYIIIPKQLEVTYDRAPSTERIELTYQEEMTAALIKASASAGSSPKYLYEGYEYNNDGTLSDELYSSDTFPTNAGIYTITVTPTNKNYTGRVVTTLTIARATPSISFSGATGLTYSGSGRSPIVAPVPTTLTYTTSYTGIDFGGNAYNSTDKPVSAGLYVITTSFAGNKNYRAVSNYQNFEIAKVNTATVEFDIDSLTQVYTGEPLTPTAKAFINSVENTDLALDIVITFGGSTSAPTEVGSYNVVASLYSCNYACVTTTSTFTISQSDNYTITLVSDGELSLGATSAATIDIAQAYTILYTGKEYLADGTLPTEDNYISFSLPANAGEYTGRVLSDNYTPKTFNFIIKKTNLSVNMVVPSVSIPLGHIPTLPEQITVSGTAYNVVYQFKLATATEFTTTIPTIQGEHTMKAIIVDRNYSGEKEVSYTITYSNAATSKVVLDSPYYMYTGEAIVVNSKLYLEGVLQTSPDKKYSKDGSFVSNVIDTGEYVVTMSVGSSSYEATFTVVPQINLTVPIGTIYDNTAKTVTYNFVNNDDYTYHNSKVSLVLRREGIVVSQAIDAGDYVATICYEGYPIFSKSFTISRMQIDNMEHDDVTMTYGDMTKIPKYVGTYKVRYEISVNGTNPYTHAIPPVGNHKLKLIIDDRNHQGQLTINLTVSKKLFVLDIDDLEVEYTGSQIKLPETFANLENLTYQFSSTPSNYSSGLPTNVGTYYVIASSSSNNYAVTYKDTTRPYIIVTITKATPEFIVNNLEQTYTGSALVPSATAIFNGTSYLTNVSNTNMIDAGTYKVTFSIQTNASNFNASEEYTFVINKAPVSISYSLPENLVYDGYQKTITATASIADVGTVSQSFEKDGEVALPINAGTYKATLSTEATTNYLACVVELLFDIIPAPTTVTCIVENYNYNGHAKPVVVTTNPSDSTKTILYDGSPEAPTNAGTYTATITVTPTNTNYAVETITFTYTIVKVIDTITYVGPENGFFYYDGNVKTIPEIDSGSGNHTVKYYFEESGTYEEITEDKIKDVGNYKIEVKSTGNANYYGLTKYFYFTIYKEQILASITGGVYDYDGTEKSVTLEENHNKGNVVAVYYSGKTYNSIGACASNYESTLDCPTLPGIYTATLVSTDDRYQIAGKTIADLIINRVKTDITINIAGVGANDIVIDYTGTPYAVSATATEYDGTSVNVTTMSSRAIKVTLQGFTDEVVLQEGGNYDITVEVNSQIYFGYSKRLISIKPQPATIFAKQTAVEYTGQANSLSYIVVDAAGNDISDIVEDNTTITYYNADGSPVVDNEPIAVGTYTAHITISNSSYYANDSYIFNIVKTSPRIIYNHGEDYEITTSSTTTVPKFTINSFSVKLSTGTLPTTDYTVGYYKQTYTTDENNEVIAEWTPYTVTDNEISALGSYMIRISITSAQKIAKYEASLEAYNASTAPEGYHINESGHLYWEFLLTVVPEE